MALLFESIVLEVLVGIITLVLFLYMYLTLKFDYWKKKRVPYPKPVPIFGNLKDQILGRMSQGTLLKNLYDDFPSEKFIGIFMFHDPTLIPRDPDIIRDILVKNFSSFHDRGVPNIEKREPLSGHLFSLSGQRWRALRAKLTPTFTSGKIKMMYHLMEECNEELRLHLQEPARRGEELEMREIMAQLTTDIIGSCAFGLQMNSIKNPDSEFRSMGRKAMEPSLITNLKRITVFFLPTVADYFNIGFFPEDVQKFFLNAVKETVEYREKNIVTRNDFMQLLIKLKNQEKIDDDHEPTNDAVAIHEKDELHLTDGLLAAQAFIFFLAGFETSSTLMSFALFELAINSEIQDRLRKEVDDAVQKNNGKLTYETIQKMPYLDKITSETLRKYPPVGNLIRICNKPYIIPGTNTEIDEGTRVFIPVLGLHHDPKYFPNPEKFDPEHFSEEAKANRHHFSYLPFGEGPRNCIGMRFGLLQAKLGLATLIRYYKFSPCERTGTVLELDPKAAVTAAKGGIYLKIIARD